MLQPQGFFVERNNMNTHSFSTEIATQLGIEGALILQHLYFLHQINDKNFPDYHHCTRNSTKGFSAIFTYLKECNIRKTLEKLEKLGYILIENYNEVKYDGTNRHCLTEKGLKLLTNSNSSLPNIHLSKTTNGF